MSEHGPGGGHHGGRRILRRVDAGAPAVERARRDDDERSEHDGPVLAGEHEEHEPDLADEHQPGAEPDERGRRWWGPLVVAALAVVLASWAPGPTTLTVDEASWLSRSERFATAVRDGDLDRATARYLGVPSTMPGVTTMAAGTLGRGLAEATHAVGLSGEVAEHSRFSPQVLRAGRFVMTLASAAVLGLLVVYAARLLGRRAALVAGVVLATEPWVLGHVSVLHTDALLTLLTALAAVAWAVASGAWTGAPDRRAALVAGTATGLALLTKVTAVATIGSALVVLVPLGAVRLVVSRRRPGRAVALEQASLLAAALLAAVATTFVLWPALWTSPTAQVEALRESVRLGDVEYPTFVDGEVVIGPGRDFLLRTVPFRMSPWLLLGGLVALVATTLVVVDRRRAAPAPRTLLVGLTLAAVPYLVAVSAATKVYDRYALPLWPFLSLLVGVWVAEVAGHVPVRRPALRLAGGVAVAALALPGLAMAPYRTAYVSRLAGGQARAAEEIPLGWGEGVERLGATLAEREAGRCADIAVLARPDAGLALPCGELVTDRPDDAGTTFYVVRTVSTVQRPVFDSLGAEVEARGTLVERVEIGGVSYAELWLLPAPG